jgi:hypothetical protein
MLAVINCMAPKDWQFAMSYESVFLLPRYLHKLQKFQVNAVGFMVCYVQNNS